MQEESRRIEGISGEDREERTNRNLIAVCKRLPGKMIIHKYLYDGMATVKRRNELKPLCCTCNDSNNITGYLIGNFISNR